MDLDTLHTLAGVAALVFLALLAFADIVAFKKGSHAWEKVGLAFLALLALADVVEFFVGRHIDAEKDARVAQLVEQTKPRFLTLQTANELADKVRGIPVKALSVRHVADEESRILAYHLAEALKLAGINAFVTDFTGGIMGHGVTLFAGTAFSKTDLDRLAGAVGDAVGSPCHIDTAEAGGMSTPDSISIFVGSKPIVTTSK